MTTRSLGHNLSENIKKLYKFQKRAARVIVVTSARLWNNIFLLKTLGKRPLSAPS